MADARAEEYQRKIDSYSEGSNPIELQAKSPALLADLIRDVPDEALRRRPAEGKWSVCAILAHLAEDELVSTWRYRQMIENSGTPLPGFDQDEWARLGNYESWDVREALGMFRLLRDANLRMLRSLTSEEWLRFGVHQERGKITVNDLARHMAGHDANHIEQVRRLLSEATTN